jgi:RND family efflux transporter MFP subunit
MNRRLNGVSRFLLRLQLFLAGGVLILGNITSCSGPRPLPPPNLPKVVLAEAEEREVQLYEYFTGRTEAHAKVDVRARVKGFLDQILFQPSDYVKAGDPLFVIQPEEYQARLDAAEAQLSIDLAKQRLAEANLARAQELVASNAVSQQEVDTRTAQVAEAKAKVALDRAEIARHQLDYSYTQIAAPISGMISRNLVDRGNLVGDAQEATLLATIVNPDPMYVYFEISDSQLLQTLKKLRADRKTRSEVSSEKTPSAAPAEGEETTRGSSSEGLMQAQELENAPFAISLEGQEAYPYKGKITYMDNQIDPYTGTMTLRGEIPNPDHLIFSGWICNVQVPHRKKTKAVLVRQEAITTDLNSKYLLVVDDKNVVHRRNVELGETLDDGMRIVKKGLKSGEKYIVEGTQQARVEQPIEPISSSEVSGPQNGDTP